MNKDCNLHSRFTIDDSRVLLPVHILSAEQIRAWDQYTITQEPILSIDLMERAARKSVEWIKAKPWQGKVFRIFCGKGNNGGDGLAIGRMLLKAGYAVSFYILEFGKLGSDDFQINLQRLHELPSVDLHFLQAEENFPALHGEDIVIDALFGSGLNKPLQGLTAKLVDFINKSGVTTVAIDLPSGLFIEKTSLENAVIKAAFTLTFQCYKMGLLVQESAPFIGEVHVLDIGLHPQYLQQVGNAQQLLDEVMIRKIFRPRSRFAHKGTFGHALIVGGSYGKMGALVLATKACLYTGAGLTTAFLPRCGYNIIQTALPEAMTMMDDDETHLTSLPDDIERFTAIGVGPGMGTQPDTQKLLSFLVRRYQKPMVIDADGLNCLSQNKELLAQLPSHSILTPHPKEFDRLFGEHQNDFARIETAKQKATDLKIILLVKGHHTFIATPDGKGLFNSTGNAGMAKGGSGDVLTGILTSLLAQGYSPVEAVQLGVYIHGWAGDLAAKHFSKEAMLSSHLVRSLSEVFLHLNK
jgi:NAD(P)H-hydrate epimerase